MGWSKQQLINMAFDSIGKSVDIFNIDPDAMQDALSRLDSMMATWNGKGIRLGYPIPSTQEGSTLNQDSGLPDMANEAVYTNLGLRIANSIGKQVSPMLMSQAKEAYNVLLMRPAFPPQQQLPETMPRGAGNKPYRNYNRQFVTPPVDPLTAGPDGEIDFN